MARKELDRFDMNAKRDVRISTKLTTLFGIAIIVCCFGIAFGAVTIFEHQIVENARVALNDSANGIASTLEEWIDELKGFSIAFADRADVIEGISANNVTMLSEISRGKKNSMGIDLLAFTNKKGDVIVSSSFRLCNTNLLRLAPVDQVLKGGTFAYSFEQIGEYRYAAIVVSPVKKDGVVVGAVVICFDLANEEDGGFVQTMNDYFSVECTIFKENSRVSTTLRDESGASLSGTTLQNDEIYKQVYAGKTYEGRVAIDGTAYLSVYLPIRSGNGNITGMVFIAKSLETINKVRSEAIKILFPIAIVLTIIVGAICLYFVNWLMWRIKNVTEFLKEMATGEADLTKRVKLLIRDEIGDLVIQFDFFCDKLQQIVRELKNSKDGLTSSGNFLSSSTENAMGVISQIITNIDSVAGQINNQAGSVDSTATSVDEISNNITSLNDMIETQASGVSEASASIEQMIGNIAAVNNSVEMMANSFDSLSKYANMGFSKQQDVNIKIKQIESQSELLQEANQVISSIAEQTNLLAMNAAIEAAHAGEAGKGFSVVADEIRKLSETSSAQSKTIGDQLNEIKNAIAQVVKASEESSAAFTSVSSKIKQTDELVIQIKAAMEEQNTGSKQIGDALKSMNDSTVEVRNASQSMSTKNDRIMKEMAQLKEITTNMKKSMDEMAFGAQKIDATGTELGDISKEVQSSITKIGNQVDLFKV